MSTVRDIIDAIKHRLPDRINLYPSLNTAVRLTSKRLKYHNLSMIKGIFSITVAADTGSQSLPSDYWGMMGKPYISGQLYPLEPVPSLETELQYQDDATPIYYEVLGQTLYVIPGTTSEITVKGKYWKKETSLSKPSDTMPFFEMFDDVIQEGLIKYYTSGETALRDFINSAVDEVVPGIDGKGPIRIVDTMQLDGRANRDWWT